MPLETTAHVSAKPTTRLWAEIDGRRREFAHAYGFSIELDGLLNCAPFGSHCIPPAPTATVFAAMHPRSARLWATRLLPVYQTQASVALTIRDATAKRQYDLRIRLRTLGVQSPDPESMLLQRLMRDTRWTEHTPIMLLRFSGTIFLDSQYRT